jgi:hypothetical protein
MRNAILKTLSVFFFVAAMSCSKEKNPISTTTAASVDESSAASVLAPWADFVINTTNNSTRTFSVSPTLPPNPNNPNCSGTPYNSLTTPYQNAIYYSIPWSCVPTASAGIWYTIRPIPMAFCDQFLRVRFGTNINPLGIGVTAVVQFNPSTKKFNVQYQGNHCEVKILTNCAPSDTMAIPDLPKE